MRRGPPAASVVSMRSRGHRRPIVSAGHSPRRLSRSSVSWEDQVSGFTSVADAPDHLQRTALAAWVTATSRSLVQELLEGHVT